MSIALGSVIGPRASLARPPSVIVAGTDTGVGKTVFAAGLTVALTARYWKPVQAGLQEETDTQTVARLARLPADRLHAEAWRLNTPASPHCAAQIDGVAIDPTALTPPEGKGPLVIEGAGGLMVPLNRETLFIDVFQRWGTPVILCARTSLGTINHTLLSLEALRARDIPVIGVAFIGEANEDSETTICEISGAARLGRLAPLDPLTPQTLAKAFAAGFPMLALPGDEELS